ncbi:MAG: G5 domain-containing protein [Anaerolineae bacterium]
MKRLFWLWLGLVLLACQPQIPHPTLLILDGEKVYRLKGAPGTPADALAQVGIRLEAEDRLLLNGKPVALDQPLGQDNSPTLQVRRAFTVTVHTPEGERSLRSAAFTVGEALHQAGFELYASDAIDPPAETALLPGMTIHYTPSRPLTVQVGGQMLHIRSSAETVGAALARAGIPLIGLDSSQPSESEALPADGQIRLIRVSEAVVLAQKSIPFESEFQASANLALDQQEILQPGQAGLSVSRIRIRYEDGQEVSRQTEAETLVRAPQKRIIGYGTKVEIKTATVDGVTFEYWRAVRMYATSYSPCRSAPGRCYPNTASGKPVKKGVVSVVYRWYVAMRGQPLYIPGYGYATIEDVGGGIPGRLWIDLGYSDDDYQQWGQWVTVYFLTPVPANILYVLD